MKMTNMRTVHPVIRSKILKFEASPEAHVTFAMVFNAAVAFLPTVATEVYQYFEIRLKSVNFRAVSGLAIGERTVTVMGRELNAIFPSNSMTATVDFKDNQFGLWTPSYRYDGGTVGDDQFGYGPFTANDTSETNDNITFRNEIASVSNSDNGDVQIALTFEVKF